MGLEPGHLASGELAGASLDFHRGLLQGGFPLQHPKEIAISECLPGGGMVGEVEPEECRCLVEPACREHFIHALVYTLVQQLPGVCHDNQGEEGPQVGAPHLVLPVPIGKGPPREAMNLDGAKDTDMVAGGKFLRN